jgi:tetratricopeptide (TPR) repeat protein
MRINEQNMTTEPENICLDCHAFRPVSYEQDDEMGICLLDPIFEPYLDEIVEWDSFESCRQLVQEKMFSGGQEACTFYDEIDYPEDSPDPLDLMQEFDGVPVRQLQDYDVEKAGSSFQNHSFYWRLKHDTHLRELRSRFEGKSPEERRMASDFEYHSSLAERLINEAQGKANSRHRLPGEVCALAIDPGYAPALLTVGSYEILLGRIEEGLELLLSLVDLPGDTEDLHVIIDKAGRFLLDQLDSSWALALYEKAAKLYPDEQLFQAGIAACSPRETK